MTPVLDLYLDHGALLNALTVFGLFTLVVLALWLREIFPTVARMLEIGWIIAGLGFIALLTLSPVSVSGTQGFESPAIHQLINELTSSSSLSFQWPDWHDPIGNIMMTVPLACAIGLSSSARKTILLIFLLAVGIEITQYFYGHGRTAQISDIALNTLGGCVGALLAKSSHALFNRLPKQTITG